jgi:hypothetical protein
MKKLIYLFALAILVSGCVTVWDKQRQRIFESYSKGEMTAEQYRELSNEINQREGEYRQKQCIQQQENNRAWQSVAEKIKAESDKQTEEFNKAEQQRYQNQLEYMKALQGNKVNANCHTTCSGNTCTTNCN